MESLGGTGVKSFVAIRTKSRLISSRGQIGAHFCYAYQSVHDLQNSGRVTVGRREIPEGQSQTTKLPLR
jgi:hypothetical protein